MANGNLGSPKGYQRTTFSKPRKVRLGFQGVHSVTNSVRILNTTKRQPDFENLFMNCPYLNGRKTINQVLKFINE